MDTPKATTGKEGLWNAYCENRQWIIKTLDHIIDNLCAYDEDDGTLVWVGSHASNMKVPASKPAKSEKKEEKKTKSKKHEDGRDQYPKIKLHGSGNRAEFYIHHIAALVNDPVGFEAYAIGGGSGQEPDRLDVSHLCGNTHCITAGHLVFEEHSLNQKRDKQGCCKSPQALTACEHEPKCILKH